MNCPSFWEIESFRMFVVSCHRTALVGTRADDTVEAKCLLSWEELVTVQSLSIVRSSRLKQWLFERFSNMKFGMLDRKKCAVWESVLMNLNCKRVLKDGWNPEHRVSMDPFVDLELDKIMGKWPVTKDYE